MFRIKIILIVIGGVLAFFGFQEFRLSSGASGEPVSADLAAAEAGTEPSSPHVVFGPHSAIYGASIYEYRQSKYSREEPGPSTKVSHAYYPVISTEHPFNVAWDALAEKYGSFDEVPETETFPDLTTFAVLVKTKRFDTVGSIPDGISDEPSIQGLLINRVSGLDKEEEKLIKQSFPQVDVDSLLILEEGRKPSGYLKSFGMIFGGAVLALLGVGWFFVGGGSQ
jgi:hypothetical protein